MQCRNTKYTFCVVTIDINGYMAVHYTCPWRILKSMGYTIWYDYYVGYLGMH